LRAAFALGLAGEQISMAAQSLVVGCSPHDSSISNNGGWNRMIREMQMMQR
jgi:hypothetical protein